MPQGPAARITDPVVHPLPPILIPGPGSLNTLIGFLPAWRGIPTAAAAGLQAAKQAADIAVQTAVAATAAAVGPAIPIAYAAEQTLKGTIAASLGSAISSLAAGCGADIHLCVTPAPVPPHGPGVVVDGSPTVLINNLPACRQGDTIIEPLGPPNKIAMGCPTVIIGQSGSGSSGSPSQGTPKNVTATGQAVPGRAAKSDQGGSGTAKDTPPPSTGGSWSPGVGPQGGTGPVNDLGGDGGSPPEPPAAQALTQSAQTGQPLIGCGPG